LLFRAFERDLLPMCAEEAIAVIPYNPLAGGLLTGKHDRTAPPPEGTRFSLGSAGPGIRLAIGMSASSKPSKSCARSPTPRA
jgi:aryl-alcohol dehydrogenase-like predicted oxidoreductase